MVTYMLDVLILTTDYGEGHSQAARALKTALGDLRPDLKVCILNFVQFINPILDVTTRFVYFEMVLWTPSLYSRFYRMADNLAEDSLSQIFLNHLGLKKLLQYLEHKQPKVIVSTFPTPAGVVSQMKRKGLISTPTVTVVTDNSIHNQWIHPATDLYVVGSNYVQQKMLQLGVAPEQIKITGIPINPVYDLKLNQQTMRQKLRLSPDFPVVLVMGGAYGRLGRIYQICQVLQNFSPPVQVVAICGKDQPTRRRLQAIADNSTNPIQILGYINNVHEYMSAADLIITKAGGLTTSEALAKELPLIIFKPLPGQEEENTNYLVEAGAALLARTNHELASCLKLLLTNPLLLSDIKNKVLEIKKPNASRNAAALLFDFFSGNLEANPMKLRNEAIHGWQNYDGKP
jgi:processive 1,2-diacylglycerol beta-glucosyltransferase